MLRIKTNRMSDIHAISAPSLNSLMHTSSLGLDGSSSRVPDYWQTALKARTVRA